MIYLDVSCVKGSRCALSMISCIIPCYGSQDTISNVMNELKKTFEKRSGTNYEIILVNDASPDGVLDIIRKLCEDDTRVKMIDLAKNFGQHNAIMAGINHAQGDYYVLMDDDGQTPPSELWKLIDALDDACDVAIGRYVRKQHSLWRNIGSGINNYMARVLIGKPKNLALSSYIACKSFVAKEIVRYNGSYPYIAGLLLRTSGKIRNVNVFHRERQAGHSGYTMKTLLSLWLNGFTAFSVKPLRISMIIGSMVSMFGFVYAVIIIIQRLIDPTRMMGFTSLMAALLFIGGLLMIMLGLVGEYIGRMYIGMNNSPQYVVREKIGFGAHGDEEDAC